MFPLQKTVVVYAHGFTFIEYWNVIGHQHSNFWCVFSILFDKCFLLTSSCYCILTLNVSFCHHYIFYYFYAIPVHENVYQIYLQVTIMIEMVMGLSSPFHSFRNVIPWGVIKLRSTTLYSSATRKSSND